MEFWAFYAAVNPIAAWLLDALARPGHTALFRIAIATHDVIVNIVLALPFAIFLVALRSLNHWLFVLIAVLAGLVVAYRSTEWSWQLSSSFGFWLGFSMALLSLPLAFAGLRALRRILSRDGHASAG